MTIHEQFEQEVNAKGFEVFPLLIASGVKKPAVMVANSNERDELLNALSCVCDIQSEGNGFWIFPAQPDLDLEDIAEVATNTAKHLIAKALDVRRSEVEEYQPGQTATPLFHVNDVYCVAVFHYSQLPEGYDWDKANAKLEGFGSHFAIVQAKPETEPIRQEPAALRVQQMRNILALLPEKYNDAHLVVQGFVLVDASPFQELHAMTRKPIADPVVELKFKKIL